MNETYEWDRDSSKETEIRRKRHAFHNKDVLKRHMKETDERDIWMRHINET